jgi:hypothetical protein
MFEQSLNILRLSEDPDMEEVRKAYVRLTRRYPPEHFPDKFKQLKQAYEQLRLQWPALEQEARSLAESDSLAQLASTLLGEALELARTRETGAGPHPAPVDVRELDPVLRAGEVQRVLKAVLTDITIQGLPYET